jgi:hypothetical protein
MLPSETPMTWFPLALASPIGPCILVVDDRPYAIHAFSPKDGAQPRGWFLPLAALDGSWRQVPDLPQTDGWLVVERASPDDGPGYGGFGICTSVWFRRFPSPSLRWALLPPWPTTAHARLQALAALT